MRRVAITGVGVIAPLGRDISTCAARLEANESASQFMESWQGYHGLRCLVGAPAELRDEHLIPRQSRRSMGRLSLFAVQACQQALGGSGLSDSEVKSPRTGCVIGSTMGSAQSLAEAFEIMLPDHDLTRLPAMKFFQCLSHTAAMNVSQYLGISGVVLAPSAACASGLQAVGLGFDLIRMGKQDCMLCGGAEELHPTVTAAFDLLLATSSKYNDCPEKTPRPFDKDRDGLICGEGAGMVLIEEYDRAVARKARLLGEIIGFHTAGSGVHISQSNAPSMALCMEEALKDAKVRPDEVDYLNAHATGTLQGDAEEAIAIKGLFGSGVPVSSLKGHLGHTLAASGVIELIMTLTMMERGQIYPTRNLEVVAPDCAGIDHVTQIRAQRIRTFMKTSFGLGGIHAALVCRRTEDDGRGDHQAHE